MIKFKRVVGRILRAKSLAIPTPQLLNPFLQKWYQK